MPILFSEYFNMICKYRGPFSKLSMGQMMISLKVNFANVSTHKLVINSDFQNFGM